MTLSPKTAGSTSGFGGLLTLDAQEAVAEHYHPYSEEFLYVVSGELQLRLDGELVNITTGNWIMVPIGVRHRLLNVGTTVASVVFHLSPLAPRPELGHVDTEDVDTAQPQVTVGGNE
ncbi:cupin domain-containing protein [Nocardia salmonicida]|uniref:cupin domain-containing protein n=1 Tax=Nocardia salmonicida TaxID=53431 RepID=UPI003CEE774E